MPGDLPLAETPNPSSGQDSDDQWADVIKRLEAIRPSDPEADALDRVWNSVVQRVEDSANPVVRRLMESQPAEPSQAVLDRIWWLILREISPTRAGAYPRGGRISWGWAVAAALLLVVLLVGTANKVSAASLPGTPLYPVKRAIEAVRWGLAYTPQSRSELALELADRRQKEAADLVIIGAEPKLVSETLDEALVNLLIAAPRAPPKAVASRIDIWQKTVQQWPPDYQKVTAAAIDKNIQPITEALQVLEELTPTPTPTSTPTVTPTLTPTATRTRPAFTATPTETKKPPPTDTPTPTVTPRPTDTALPYYTPTPTATTKPKPKPTQPPKPTEPPPTPTRPRPTVPPAPTDTPKPRVTDTPAPYP